LAQGRRCKAWENPKKAGDTASTSRRQSLGKPTTMSDEKFLMRFLSLSGMFSNMTLQLFGSTYGLDKLDLLLFVFQQVPLRGKDGHSKHCGTGFPFSSG